ncbi:hypothetical protein ACIQZB_03630 [Streptomyces sp. NPDC097727]|uniref:hypothetical protein n=1 Tax=Streptomyces sp. NPDC097727 TaxID=3366092 RepID=UPI0038117C97
MPADRVRSGRGLATSRRPGMFPARTHVPGYPDPHGSRFTSLQGALGCPYHRPQGVGAPLAGVEIAHEQNPLGRLHADGVLPADPAAVLGRSVRGLNDLYAALTRAT